MSNFHEIVFSPLDRDLDEVTSISFEITPEKHINSNNSTDNSEINEDIPQENPLFEGHSKSSYLGASYNFINSIVGAGIIGNFFPN